MSRTILITGANGSLAIPGIQHLLATYPHFTLILTVRNTSSTDPNTKRIHDIISQYPTARSSIHQLDLSVLAEVHAFASTTIAEITSGTLPPLAGIICNAFHWNLVNSVELTTDGYEKTFQVNHLAQAALVLRLVGSFAPEGGRVVLLASDAHFPGKNGLEKYPPAIPEDLERLVSPGPDEPVDNFGHGFYRYAVSKLAIVMWMHALNRHLEQAGPKLSKITAIAINPGNLSDSRALRTNTPTTLTYLSRFIIKPLQPFFRLIDRTMRIAAEAGADVVDLAVKDAYSGRRGYFTLLAQDTSSPESLAEDKQQKLWQKTIEWGGITSINSAVLKEYE